jgi:predicted amidophosphoribosyltransferase
MKKLLCAEWRKLRNRKGLCVNCGKKYSGYYCPECRAKKRHHAYLSDLKKGKNRKPIGPDGLMIRGRANQ